MVRLRRQGTDDATCEVKASETTLSKDIWDSVSAFANTEGGTILLGVREAEDFSPIPSFEIDKVLNQFVDGMGLANPSGTRVTNPPSFQPHRLALDAFRCSGSRSPRTCPTTSPASSPRRVWLAGVTSGLTDVTVHPGLEKSVPGSATRFLDRAQCEGPLAEVVAEAVGVVTRLQHVPVSAGGAIVEGQGSGVPFMINAMLANALDRPLFSATPDQVRRS